jgi:SAM-dependent methyltransferase
MTEYRATSAEQTRTKDLMGLLPDGIASALDIGARDGFLSKLLADRIDAVTALDLTQPRIDDPRVRCVEGDASALAFDDATFELVLCAEVLEHLPGAILAAACGEMSRVSSRYLLIGVPYRQDLRLDRSLCLACGQRNPPWGHVNSFDEARLGALFPRYRAVATSYVGQSSAVTNALSARLMDLARNPYGTYVQDEPCIHCGAALVVPPPRTFVEKLLTRAAVVASRVQARFVRPRAKWVHVLFERAAA